MARENTPTDNSVAERYMRTFKEHIFNRSLIGPEYYDKGSTAASMLMLEPLYSKAQSEHISEDPRLPHVKKYKSDKQKVMGFLQELAAQKAELVDKTPFDSFENQLAYKIIDSYRT